MPSVVMAVVERRLLRWHIIAFEAALMPAAADATAVDSPAAVDEDPGYSAAAASCRRDRSVAAVAEKPFAAAE